MTDYEHFLENKESITAALEDAITKTLAGMTHEQIMEIPWFNHKMWEDPAMTYENTKDA